MDNTIRPYQQEALDSISESYQQGTRRMQIKMITGSGKTHLFCRCAKFLGITKSTIILVNREELVYQTYDKLKAVHPDEDIAIDMGDLHPKGTEKFYIVSVPTLGRLEENERRFRYNPKDVGLVICDENQYAAATTWKRVISYFLDGNSDCLLMGFSSTPSRHDGKDLTELFGDVVYSYDLRRGMQEGYLVPSLKAFKVNTGVDISECNQSGSDFSLVDLANFVDVSDRNNIILKTIKEHINNESTLIYAVNIQHANNINTLLKKNGLASAVVTSETDSDEREASLRKFKQGEIKFLVNVAILTVGTDLPIAKNIIMARPTQSEELFQQICGRILRVYPGKNEATLFDLTDNTSKHKLVTTSSAIGGLSSAFDCEGKDVLEVADRVKAIAAVNPNIDISTCKSFKEIEIKLQEVVNLFDFDKEDDVKLLSSFSWIKCPDASFRLKIGADWLTIKQKEMGIYVIKHGNAVVCDSCNFTNAFRIADRYIKGSHKKEVTLVKKKSEWHDRAVSPAQISTLRKFGISHAEIAKLNRKQASTLISKFLIQKKFKVNFK